MSTLYVGADMAHTTFTAAYWFGDDGKGLGQFANTEAGFQPCLQQVNALAPTLGATEVHLIVEPTAGYELAWVLYAFQHGWQVSLPNPKYVHDWIRGTGHRAKTDPQDALRLAEYGAERKPAPWHPVAEAMSELESLLQRKDDLEHLLQQERNRQAALAHRPHTAPLVQKNMTRVLTDLEAALAEIEQAIQDHLDCHSDLKQEAKRLRQVPGIGSKNVLYLLVLLHRWHALTEGHGESKSLVAYVGIDPKPYTSGTSVRRRSTISRMGNRELRRRLFLSALGGVRGKTVLHDFYERLVQRGKPKMVALMAAARKILVWAWAVFRQATSFDPTRASSSKA